MCSSSWSNLSIHMQQVAGYFLICWQWQSNEQVCGSTHTYTHRHTDVHTYTFSTMRTFLILPGCVISAHAPYVLRGSGGSLWVVLKSLENDVSADALVPCFGHKYILLYICRRKKIIHSLPRSNLFWQYPGFFR